MTQQELDHLLPPARAITSGQRAIRLAGINLAQVIAENTKHSAERVKALNVLADVVHTAYEFANEETERRAGAGG